MVYAKEIKVRVATAYIVIFFKKELKSSRQNFSLRKNC